MICTFKFIFMEYFDIPCYLNNEHFRKRNFESSFNSAFYITRSNKVTKRLKKVRVTNLHASIGCAFMCIKLREKRFVRYQACEWETSPTSFFLGDDVAVFVADIFTARLFYNKTRFIKLTSKVNKVKIKATDAVEQDAEALRERRQSYRLGYSAIYSKAWLHSLASRYLLIIKMNNFCNFLFIGLNVALASSPFNMGLKL